MAVETHSEVDRQVAPAVMKVRDKQQLTIPHALSELYGIEAGTIVVLEPTDEGILLRPQKLIDDRNRWLQSSEWQVRESAVEQAIDEGRLEQAESTEALFGPTDQTDQTSPYGARGRWAASAEKTRIALPGGARKGGVAAPSVRRDVIANPSAQPRQG